MLKHWDKRVQVGKPLIEEFKAILAPIEANMNRSLRVSCLFLIKEYEVQALESNNFETCPVD